MARTRTLAQLRADVCDAADIVDGGTTGRHTTANLNRRINQAIQQFQRLVTECGQPTYLKRTDVSTATSATQDASGWAPRDYLTLPSDFYHLVGIDITQGSTTISMQDFMTAERNQFRDVPTWLSTNGIGMPVYYQTAGKNAAGSRIVRVIPAADAVYTCTIFYLPYATDLATDSDTFDGIAGYEDWVIYQAAMDSLRRDGTSPTYAALQAERDRLQVQMAAQFARSAGPGRRIDTKLARQRLGRWARGDWRVG